MVLFWRKKKQINLKSLFAKAMKKGSSVVHQTSIRIHDYAMEIKLFEGCEQVHTATAYKNFEFENQTSTVDCVVNVYPFPTDVSTVIDDAIEDERYYYSYKQFEDFFYYRKDKEKEVYDLILTPNDYNLEALDNVFRMIFSSRCIEKDMILLHASCVVKDQKAILFIGQSGAGKSTIARLSKYPLIHDDLISLKRLDNGRVSIMTVPFKPIFEKHTFEGEIDCIYRIYQSPDNYLESIDKREQLAQLLFALWSFDDFRNNKSSYQDRALMSFCKRMIDDMTIKKLFFTKSDDFLELL